MSHFGNQRGCRSLRKSLVAGVAACLASAATPVSAVSLNSPVQPGDAFFTNNNLSTLSQVRNGVRQGGTIAFLGNYTLGGFFVDAGANLCLAQNDAALTTPSVERVAVGQTTSAVVLSTADFAGGGGTALRDLT